MVYCVKQGSQDQLFLDYPKLSEELLPMTPMPREFEWMPAKYGQVMRPWWVTVQIPNERSNDTGQYKCRQESNLQYSFVLKDGVTGKLTREREPFRFIDLLDPNTYRGQLG